MQIVKSIKVFDGIIQIEKEAFMSAMGCNRRQNSILTARFSFGISAQEFMRGYSAIQYPGAALKKNADYIVKLAKAEA